MSDHPPDSEIPPADFYVTGGTLPLDAPSYVERRADAELLDALSRGEFCYVLDTRQMGKSSLMVRAARRLREAGRRVAVLDLTALGQNLTAEQWYSGLLARTGAQAGRTPELLAFWKGHRELGPMQRFVEAIRNVLLTPPPGQDTVADLVLFVDEIDAVRGLPFSADELFGGIRECYNRRPQDPAFAHLTFCLLGVAAPTDLVRDTRLSPFNIGRRIELHDFTTEEAAPLAGGLTGDRSRALRLLRRILRWTGGHPYMTQRLCRGLAERVSGGGGWRGDDALVDGLCRDLFLTQAAQEADDNLAFVRDRLLHAEADPTALLDFYLKIHRGRRVRDDAADPLCSLLRLSGVVATARGRLAVRNRVYDRVFDREWVRAHMPEAEVRRQRQAYRRGALRAAGLASVGLLLLAGLAGLAIRSAVSARQATARARQATTRAQRDEALSQLRLSRAYVETGTVLMGGCDAGAALAPLVETMHLDAGDPARLAQDRRRIASALASAPRLGWVWFADGPLLWAALSPDRTRAAAGGEDGRVRVWDLRTGHEIPLSSTPAEVTTKAGAITGGAWSPDGTRLATCGTDDRARIWDVSNHRLLWTLSPLTSSQDKGKRFRASADWSRDGRLLATACGDTVTVWNVAGTGRFIPSAIMPFLENGAGLEGVALAPDDKSLAVVAGNYLGWQIAVPSSSLLSPLGSHDLGYCFVGRHVAYSRDGRRLLVAGEFGAKGPGHPGACVFSTTTTGGVVGRPLLPLLQHDSGVLYAAYSPDESRIATASEDGTARVWDAASGQPVTPPLMVGHPVAHVEFSPDGHRVVTADDDGTARVWDAATGRTVCSPMRHAGPLATAQFTTDGDHIFTAGQDGTARLWTLPRTAPEHDFQMPQSPGYALLAGNTRLVLFGSHILDYDLVAQKLLPPLPTIKLLSATSAGTHFLLSWAESAAQGGAKALHAWQVWDALTGRPISPLLHGAQVFLSPDGNALLLHDSHGTLHLLDTMGHPILPPLHGVNPIPPSSWMPFTPDGRAFLVQDSLESVRLIDRRTGRPLTPPLKHQGPVTHCAFSPDSRSLFTWTTTRDGEKPLASVWDLKANPPRQGPPCPAYELAEFSPDGSVAILPGTAASLRWRLHGPDPLHPQSFLTLRDTGHVISPDGRSFVVRNENSWLWDTDTLRPGHLSVDYGEKAEAAAFSPDGRRVLVVLSDGTAAFWDARTGRLLTPILPQSRIHLAAFSADGSMAATAGVEGTVRVWDANTGEALTTPLTTPHRQCVSLTFIDAAHVLATWNDGATLLSVPTTEERLPQLQALAGLLSGRRIDPDIGPIPADPTTLRADWALVDGGR